MNNNQQQFATLGSTIGSVTKLSGSVVVQSIISQERLIKIGDPVFFSETVVAQDSGSVLIDKAEIAIGPYSIVELSDVNDGPGDIGESIGMNELLQSSIVSANELQQAILNGADPTLIQEAPAADESIIDDQQRVDVTVFRNNKTALPSYGFDTDGKSSSSLFDVSYETRVGSSDLALSSEEVVSGAEEGSVVSIFGIETTTDSGGSLSPDVSSAPNSIPVPNVSIVADTTADAGTVLINDITEDDVINLTENNQIITITGTAAGGDISEGDLVTLVVNHVTYTSIVDSFNNWSVDVAGSDLADDAQFTAIVSSNDAVGNTVETTGSSAHTVDTKAFGQIDTYKVTDDATISAAESAVGETVDITGYVGNDARPGDLITVNLDDLEIGRGIVSDVQDANGKYLYTVPVLGADLANTTQTNPNITVIVSGEDDAGNPFSTQTTEAYFIEAATLADVYVFIDDGNYDGVITEGEAESLLVGGWVESGNSVSSIMITDSLGAVLTIDTGFFSDDDGNWIYFENTVDVSGLANGELKVIVNVEGFNGVVLSSGAEVITKDTDEDTGVVLVDVDTDVFGIGIVQSVSAADDSIEDVASTDEGDDILIGGTLDLDGSNTDTLIAAGDDDFALDVITDFDSKDNGLDVAASLTGLLGGAENKDAVTEFLSVNADVLEQNEEGGDIAGVTFGVGSGYDFDTNSTVIVEGMMQAAFNDQEYSISING
ncbi:hypothetical protein MUS1_05805 [Marinomonas ushuaiensis DSM 15871]|uniref:Bacterial Ig-like domain-containing protein n=1 Tax=Marinomonas ushuaiensis DSM 15871 TaxID=1122207 RepID=X7E1V1_9GAMM|nr:retention module-containing protein [Marinomonas ushuaiensis]ETX09840.1 hypothetical protein MUS1_05805 [Marinomonas ushuaiensis DSM 15871]